jgi:hypothetical protein
VLEPPGVVAAGAVAQLVAVSASHDVQRLVGELADVERIDAHGGVDVVGKST